jgi:hypothetical protein
LAPLSTCRIRMSIVRTGGVGFYFDQMESTLGELEGLPNRNGPMTVVSLGDCVKGFVDEVGNSIYVKLGIYQEARGGFRVIVMVHP